jgi:hypothetical protein
MNTTGDLVAAVLEAIPRKYQDKRIHPATRTFQAIRIAVNRELEELQPSLEAICGCLRVGGAYRRVSLSLAGGSRGQTCVPPSKCAPARLRDACAWHGKPTTARNPYT